MFLSLESFQESDLEIPVSSEVTFGYYMGESEPLLEAVGQVEKGWPSFFTENSLVYCAYVDGEIASFCLIEDMGTYRIDGNSAIEQKYVGAKTALYKTERRRL